MSHRGTKVSHGHLLFFLQHVARNRTCPRAVLLQEAFLDCWQASGTAVAAVLRPRGMSVAARGERPAAEGTVVLAPNSGSVGSCLEPQKSHLGPLRPGYFFCKMVFFFFNPFFTVVQMKRIPSSNKLGRESAGLRKHQLIALSVLSREPLRAPGMMPLAMCALSTRILLGELDTNMYYIHNVHMGEAQRENTPARASNPAHHSPGASARKPQPKTQHRRCWQLGQCH